MEGAAILEPVRSRLQRWGPFVLLILAGGSRWIVAGVHPEADPTLASEALGCLWAALVAWLLLGRRPDRFDSTAANHSSWRPMLAGAMLFGGPAIALLTRARDLDSGGLTIALALTPVMIAITASALGNEASEGIAGRLWPGLAATAGLLLLLAQPALGDLRGDLALVLAPLLTGIGAALFCADQKRASWSVIYALLGATVLFSLALAESYFVAGTKPAVSLLAVACDGTLSLVGTYTLMQLGATRWSSQFALVPLLIVVEGIVLIRPELTAHWVVGLALLALASLFLLLPEPRRQGAATPSTAD